MLFLSITVVLTLLSGLPLTLLSGLPAKSADETLFTAVYDLSPSVEDNLTLDENRLFTVESLHHF